MGRWVSMRVLAQACAAATTAYAITALAILAAGTLTGSGAAFQRTGAIELFGYSHFRFYNHVQVVVVPLTVAVAAFGMSARWRWVARIGAAASLALLFHSFSRAAVLAMAAALVVVIVGSLRHRALLGRSGRRWVLEAVGAAALGAALVVLLASLQSTGPGPAFNPQITGSRDESNLERLSVLRFALGQWAEAPLWGVGPMHLAGMRGMIAAHPHNAWLQVAAEWGTLALLGVAAAASVAARRLWRTLATAPQEHSAWGLVLLATGVAVGVDGLFSGNFVMPMSQLWIALLAGAWLAWWRELPGRTAPPAPVLGRPVVAAMLAVQVWLVLSIAPEARQLSAHLQALEQRYPNTVVNPRFWSHGWFGEPGPRR
jgi:O-antigen ligase